MVWVADGKKSHSVGIEAIAGGSADDGAGYPDWLSRITGEAREEFMKGKYLFSVIVCSSVR